MQMQPNIRIGGVPEHFNLPWLLAIEKGLFNHKPYSIEWKEYPEGTGAMCKDLKNNSLDIAVVLTEGIASDIVRGNPSKILQTYVKTPLIWGIHTAFDAPYLTADDLEGKIYAISRKGSGSHLMTFINANNRNWSIKNQQFIEVGNINNLINALQTHTADAFLWEKYTTKPYVDKQQIKRVGECKSPWSCFVIAASNQILAEYSGEVKDIMQVIQQSCKMFMKHGYAADLLGWRYQLNYLDAEAWYKQTEWSTDNTVLREMLQNVLSTLVQVGILEQTLPPEFLCSSLTNLL